MYRTGAACHGSGEVKIQLGTPSSPGRKLPEGLGVGRREMSTAEISTIGSARRTCLIAGVVMAHP